MLALLTCAPTNAGTLLPSTLEGSQKSDALAGCRFALDGRLYDVGALAGMTIAVPADIDVGNFAGTASRAQLDSGAFFHHPTSHRKSDDAVTRKAITNDYARYAAYAGQMCD